MAMGLLRRFRRCRVCDIRLRSVNHYGFCVEHLEIIRDLSLGAMLLAVSQEIKTIRRLEVNA